jgi:S1-C subfamily serine protease
MTHHEETSALSDHLASLVERTAPSVVRVDGRRFPASGLAWSEDLVLTTAHAVERDASLSVTMEGDPLPATLVGRDPGTDLALLRVEGKLVPARTGDGEGLKVGHLVLALGRPGRTVRARLGVVSALGGEVRLPGGGRLERYLESDVDPRRGFSGGPLVGTGGEVLGVNTGALLRGTLVTVSTVTLRRVVEGILSGRNQRGYLGIGSMPVRLPAHLVERAGAPTGLLVTAVEPGSPAETAGLSLGDVILSLDGVAVGDLSDLLAFLAEDRAGKVIAARVLRGGAVQELTVTVGVRS